MDLNKETYNRIAEDWHRDHLPDQWWCEGMDIFLAKLKQGSLILDVGCAGGTKSKYALDRGFKVVGIDISDKLLEIAKREAPQGEFRELPMAAIDSMPEKFEGIFAQASLLHIPKKDASAMVQKMADQLMPGGLLYIAVKERREGQLEEEVVTENDYGYDYQRFFSYYTIEELREYFAHTGITFIEEIRNPNPSGKTVWLQIIGKK